MTLISEILFESPSLCIENIDLVRRWTWPKLNVASSPRLCYKDTDQAAKAQIKHPPRSAPFFKGCTGSLVPCSFTRANCSFVKVSSVLLSGTKTHVPEGGNS